jgi:ribosomal-protein-alanine N-acetyltransferase
MKKQIAIDTSRLQLRFFQMSDAPVVFRLVGDRDIAATTTNIPHPYKEGMAEEWISTHQTKYEEDELINFAITLASTKELIGAIGLMINRDFDRAELGYWVGKPYWGQGYCTEAARAVLHFSFTDLNLNRVYANHYLTNPASGKVMEKIGMKKEGIARQHIKKWGVFHDSVGYGILRSEYKN